MIRLNNRVPYRRFGNYRPACDLRVLFKVLGVLVILILLVLLFAQPQMRNGRPCFQRSISDNDQSMIWFPDLMEDDKKPTPSKTIFFLETSCSGDGLVRLKPRQSCAIESAAKSNPDWDVFVLFASPRGIYNDSGIPPPLLIERLQSYPNIHLRNVNLWEFAKDTPAKEWLSEGRLFQSRFLREHVSDFLRLLTLYKFGGTYLDLDTVVLKSLNPIPSNYAGAEDYRFVGNTILNFAHDGFGHILAELYVREFMATYNSEEWAYNGPQLVTRVLQRLCQVQKPLFMTRERCRGFHVYPPDVFYPLPWADWKSYFDPGALTDTLRLTNLSYVIHVWNDVSHSTKIKVGLPAAYGIIANEKCPNSYRAAGEYF